MKKIVFLFIAAFFLFSNCDTPSKLLQRGQYHLAVSKSVEKLKKKPDHEKSILALEKAYPLANQQDLERIKFLQQEGSANRWDEIYQLYTRLKNRQNEIRKVTPITYNGRTIQFSYIDYDSQIIEAKKKAADYYYAHAQKLMKSGAKEDYRKAHAELKRVKVFYPSYANVDKMMREAKEKGTSRAIIRLDNKTGGNLPKDYLTSLITFGVADLNQEWVEYYIVKPSYNTVFDYEIKINLNQLYVSPDEATEKITVEERKVDDGWEYELDPNGNVKKDSLGNDIKHPKYKVISCQVIETYQKKMISFKGTIRYLDNQTTQVLLSKPIVAEHFFEHFSYTANGDLNALTPQTRKKIDIRPAPFPSDMDLVFEVRPTLQNLIKDVLWQNRSVLY